MRAATAIADPVRRDILVLLRAGPHGAGSIAERFDISRPAISRHLRVLRAAGLVVAAADERDGRGRVYELDITPLGELDAWLAQFRVASPLMAALAGAALDTEVHRTRRDRTRRTQEHPQQQKEQRTSA